MSALGLGADIAARVEWSGAALRVFGIPGWSFRLLHRMGSRLEPRRTWRIVERKSKWWMPSPGRYSLAGSEMPVAFGQHQLLKTVSGVCAIACPYRGSNNRRRQIPGNAIRPPWETVIMNPRLAAMAVWCQGVAIPALVLAWIGAFGSAGIDNTGAAPIVERPAPSLTAVAKFADELPPISLAAADAVAASRSVTE